MPKTPWTEKMDIAAWRQDTALLPELPGVYFFLDAEGSILYIGKATSLRDRVRSYFSQDIMETRGPKISLMLERARVIAYRVTDSVLEALSRGLTQKMLHGALAELHSSEGEQRHQMAEVVSRLFLREKS